VFVRTLPTSPLLRWANGHSPAVHLFIRSFWIYITFIADTTVLCSLYSSLPPFFCSLERSLTPESYTFSWTQSRSLILFFFTLAYNCSYT